MTGVSALFGGGYSYVQTINIIFGYARKRIWSKSAAGVGPKLAVLWQPGDRLKMTIQVVAKIRDYVLAECFTQARSRGDVRKRW
jgi:hypothetical protein